MTATVADSALRVPSTRAKRYPDGALIWDSSDLPDRIFRLRSGCVQILGLEADGSEHLYRVVKPGEMFGEMCFCAHRQEPHDSEARSVGPSDVWAVSYDAFAEQLRSEPGLVDAVLQTLCARVSDAEQRVKMLVHHDARERLARLLVHLAERRVDGARADVVGVSLTISHASLAAMAALSRPHVSLLIIEFRRRGLVSYQRGGPLLVNVEKLLRRFNLRD
ncbi:MAG TPA: Crp/Fnr family transcriptional regulator [Vicinamibacterales bacterium]